MGPGSGEVLIVSAPSPRIGLEGAWPGWALHQNGSLLLAASAVHSGASCHGFKYQTLVFLLYHAFILISVFEGGGENHEMVYY